MPTLTAPTLSYSHTIGQLAQSGAGFNNPVDVALGKQGRLYVLNRTNLRDASLSFLRVTVLTIDEEYIGQFCKYGYEDGQIVWPAVIATDQDEHIYVGDEQRHDVQVFDREGNFLRKLGGFGSEPGQLNRPCGLVVERDGNLLVVDHLNSRVQRFAPDGRVLGQFGSFGTEPGQFNFPWRIAVDDDGDVYVADWRNDRIQKLTPDGQPLAIFGSSGEGPGQLNRPAGVAVDGAKNVYALDRGNNRIVVFAPDGEHLATLTGEGGMSKWAEGYMAANQDVRELREAHADQFRPKEQRFKGPTGIQIDDAGRIIVADCLRHRLQVYQGAVPRR